MDPSYCYTALLDVLSYRYRLEQDVKEGTFDFKHALEKALSTFDQFNSTLFSVNAISDTIILTCSSHDHFVSFLRALRVAFLSFLENGLFIRGGLSYSKHFQSGRITYSHAIARAYELETQLSIYPRIVVDDNIIQMYRASRSLPNIFNQDLLIQQNGVTFINIVDNCNWTPVHQLASSIFDRDRDTIHHNERAFSKHQWFETYLFSSPFADPAKPKYIPSMALL